MAPLFALVYLFAFMAAPAARADGLSFVESLSASLGKDEGLAIAPASGSLLAIEASMVNEQQQVLFNGMATTSPFGGKYKLTGTFDGATVETTDPIEYRGGFSPTSNNLKAGLEALPSIAAGDIGVTGSGTLGRTVTFGGTLGGTDLTLMSCEVVIGTGSCSVEPLADGLGGRLLRFNQNGEPRPFTALGTNVIDGRGGVDQTPSKSVLGTALAPGEVQVAVAAPGAAGDTAGTVYLTYASAGLVDAFDGEGTFLGRLTEAGGSSIGEACGVAVDSDGYVYVGDRNRDEIHKYLPAASPVTNADWVASFAFADPCSLAAGAGPTEGFLFATHLGGSVEKLDSADGSLEYVVDTGPVTTVSADAVTGRIWTAAGSEVRGFDATGALSAIPFASATLAGAAEGVAARGDDVFVARAGTANVGLYAPIPTNPPLATTGPASAGGPALVDLQGEVDPQGFKVTECRFEYGPTAAYGTSVPCDQDAVEIGVGSGPVPVTASTEPLVPGTTYHYRIAVSNITQGAAGADRTFTSSSSAVGSCPNAAIRAEQGAATQLLPDCMALEMVSPPLKDSQPARQPHVSADASRVMFNGLGSLDGAPSLGTTGNPYVASRGPSGWETAAARPPSPYFKGWEYDTLLAPPASMTPDFSCWFGLFASDQQREAGGYQAFRGCLGDVLEPLSPLLLPIGDLPPIEGLEGGFQAASADHSHLFFEASAAVSSDPSGIPTVAYLPGDPEPRGAGAVRNAYLARLSPAGEPTVELVARGRDDEEGKVKAWGANCGSVVGGPGLRNQGAVSVDGSRVLFTTRPAQSAGGECSQANRLRILERLRTPGGAVIHELFPSASGVGDDRFQGASVDQSRVYFTSNRPLTPTDLDAGADCSAELGASSACDLYLYDAAQPPGERLVQASAGEDVPGHHEAGREAKVLDGTVAISGDGTHVYFAAQGVLTDDPSPEGRSAAEFAAEAPKLYLFRRDAAHPDGELAFVGPLDPADRGSIRLWGGAGSFANSAYAVPVTGTDAGGAEVGGDGHVLFFISAAAMSDDDEDGTRRDLYRYDARTDELERISKAAGGADNGSFDLNLRGKEFDPMGTDFAEVERWASEDGETAVFRTAEGLGRGDGNQSADNYLWWDGRLVRLPGEGEKPTLSHDGTSVAFSTSRPLLPFDGDATFDVYIARAGGGFPNPVVTPPCEPDRSQPGPHCRAAVSTPPIPADNPSATAPSEGNVKPRMPRRCRKGKRRVRSQGKVRCVKSKRSGQVKRNPHKGRRAANSKGRAAR